MSMQFQNRIWHYGPPWIFMRARVVDAAIQQNLTDNVCAYILYK